MRLFVAIHPDADTRAWIADTQGQLREALAQWEHDLRWVAPELIHLTLSFLGEVHDPTPVMQALESCHCVPMDLSVGKLGVFPNLRRPAALWVGVAETRETPGTLNRLQAEVAQALLPFAKPESRPFAPHLTLARIRGTPWFGRLGASPNSQLPG